MTGTGPGTGPVMTSRVIQLFGRGGTKANLQAYSKLFQISALFLQTFPKESFGDYIVDTTSHQR